MDDDTPVFRAPKRRKVFRRRDEDERRPEPSNVSEKVLDIPDENGTESLRHERPNPASGSLEDSMSEAFRIRRAPRFRRGGIGFSNAPLQISATGSDTDSMALMIPRGSTETDVPNALDAIAQRFAPQAGQAINVADDKIM